MKQTIYVKVEVDTDKPLRDIQVAIRKGIIAQIDTKRIAMPSQIAVTFPTDILSEALKELQSRTIGLFKFHGTTSVECVIENDNGMLTTVSIGSLGGLTTTHIQASQGIYTDLPSTLEEFLNKPFEFSQFYNDFVYNKLDFKG